MLFQLRPALQQIADTGQQHLLAEGLGDVGIGTGVIALGPLLIQRFGGKEDDRDMAGG